MNQTYQIGVVVDRNDDVVDDDVDDDDEIKSDIKLSSKIKYVL
jgi:hypothetical protein